MDAGTHTKTDYVHVFLLTCITFRVVVCLPHTLLTGAAPLPGIRMLIYLLLSEIVNIFRSLAVLACQHAISSLNLIGRYIGQHEFRQLYWEAVASDSIASTFGHVIGGKGSGSGSSASVKSGAARGPAGASAALASATQRVTAPDLLAFFHGEQSDPTVTLEWCESVVKRYSGPDGFFRLGNFVEFLHGTMFHPSSSILDYCVARKSIIHMLMD